MSERPQATPSGKLWRKFVNLGLEEPQISIKIILIGSFATHEDALRAQPATLLYTFKSPDSLSQEQEAGKRCVRHSACCECSVAELSGRK